MKKLEETGTRTTETVTISRAEYDSFMELKSQNEWLLEQLRLANKRRFGTSSEKVQEELMGQLSLMLNEAEAYAAPPGTKVTEVAAHIRQKRSPRLEEVLPENVPVEVVEHRLSEEERECPVCGAAMAEIGKEVRRTLKIVPAQVSIREDWYYTYACRRCQNVGTETPEAKAEKAPSVISGSFASPEAVAHIMVQKFCMGSPLYRQEQEWARQGVKLSRQTMSSWILRCAEAGWSRYMMSCTGSSSGGLCSTRTRLPCRCSTSLGRAHRRRVACGCTALVETRSILSCSACTSPAGRAPMRRRF